MATVIMVAALVTMASPAIAEHACRAAARELNGKLVRLGSNATEQAVDAAIGDSQARHPECQPEFEELGRYYQAGGSLPFPFPQAGDPAHSSLGPIGWWWNKIYVDLFDRNTVLMFLFGWELFLVPILMVLSVAATILSAPFRRQRG